MRSGEAAIFTGLQEAARVLADILTADLGS
jgi:hypothetical protein